MYDIDYLSEQQNIMAEKAKKVVYKKNTFKRIKKVVVSLSKKLQSNTRYLRLHRGDVLSECFT